MFLPEIYMYLQYLHAAPFDAPTPPHDDERTPRTSASPKSEAAQRHGSAPPHQASEWDEWKSVRDVG